MKTIFIYYSYSGNGDVVADFLKGKDIDIRKVESNYKLSNILFFQMMKGGFDAARKKKPKLINYDNNIEEYDHIIIGTPIWNSRLAPACNSILDKTDLSNKKITFILYSGSGEAKNACKRLKNSYQNSNIIILKQPKKYKEELEKLKEL